MALLVLSSGPLPLLEAGDVSVFVTQGTPSDEWKPGFGAALTTSIANIVSFEGEFARLPVESHDGSLSSIGASALLSPPFGSFVPYGGIGFGVFRQTLGDRSDTGRIHMLIVGLKWKVGIGVVRADYREIDLSGEPLAPLERRFTLGAGITF